MRSYPTYADETVSLNNIRINQSWSPSSWNIAQ